MSIDILRHEYGSFSIQLFKENGEWGCNVSRNGHNIYSQNPRWRNEESALNSVQIWIDERFPELIGKEPTTVHVVRVEGWNGETIHSVYSSKDLAKKAQNFLDLGKDHES